MKGFVWDARWVGNYGIARFAREVGSRMSAYGVKNGYRIESRRVEPASIVDPAFIWATMESKRQSTFISPGFNAGLSGSYSQALTLHDLIHLDSTAGETSRAKRLYYERLVFPAVRTSSLVFTVSEYSKSQIISSCSVDPSSVVVVGNGSSFLGQEYDHLRSRTPQHGEALGHILYVGNAKPHKNLALLFEAMRWCPTKHKLILVGPTRESLKAQGLDPCRLPHIVEIYNRISDIALATLYSGAAVVAMPSVTEGFGLAALEGMCFGVPTVYCCDAVGEVVGELGYRSPLEPSSFAEQLERALHEGAGSREKRIVRSHLFSWDTVAERFWDAASSHLEGVR